jgi:hypothetical protein
MAIFFAYSMLFFCKLFKIKQLYMEAAGVDMQGFGLIEEGRPVPMLTNL